MLFLTQILPNTQSVNKVELPVAMELLVSVLTSAILLAQLTLIGKLVQRRLAVERVRYHILVVVNLEMAVIKNVVTGLRNIEHAVIAEGIMPGHLGLVGNAQTNLIHVVVEIIVNVRILTLVLW
jgi:hypothetical protein